MAEQAEIRTCNLPVANPALYHTAMQTNALPKVTKHGTIRYVMYAWFPISLL